MTNSVVWSAVAKRNLQEIKRYYDDRNKNSDYSKKLLRVFQNAAKVIEKQPGIGKNTDFEGVKGLIILNYIIFYDVLSSHILILMIWDCRRDPAQLEAFLRHSS
jgi:addiction module RelE/StbE family toxin